VSQSDIKKVLRTWIAGAFTATKFLYGWMPPHPTFFVRREMYEQWGSFNTTLRSAADYELMLRFLYKHRFSVSYLPEIIVKMRAGGVSNSSISNRIKANKEDSEAWRINELKPRFYTSWLKPLRKVSQFIQDKKKYE
jgi:glycosyltransferase